MSKTKLTTLLAIVLIISVVANVYFLTRNDNSKNSAQTKVEMITTLTKLQVQTYTELERIGNSLVYASQQLSATGLTGYQADAVLSALVANSSFIINAATENPLTGALSRKET